VDHRRFILTNNDNCLTNIVKLTNNDPLHSYPNFN
jgi:hypothetical protein